MTFVLLERPIITSRQVHIVYRNQMTKLILHLLKEIVCNKSGVHVYNHVFKSCSLLNLYTHIPSHSLLSLKYNGNACYGNLLFYRTGRHAIIKVHHVLLMLRALLVSLYLIKQTSKMSLELCCSHLLKQKRRLLCHE